MKPRSGNLFEEPTPDRRATPSVAPLAERFRPRDLPEMRLPASVAGPSSLLGRAIEADRIPSLVLWGPPGTGKTTLARVIATRTKARFLSFSAVVSGVKEIREVLEESRGLAARGERTLLFVDEIHRFNRSQQDAFLPHVEAGIVTLIGATTENPSFEVNRALLSRCRVYTLNALTDADIGMPGEPSMMSTTRRRIASVSGTRYCASPTRRWEPVRSRSSSWSWRRAAGRPATCPDLDSRPATRISASEVNP